MSRSDARLGSRAGSRAGTHLQQAPPVSVAIERIVIDGPALNPLQTHHLHRSIERELTRLFQSERTVTPSGAIERLRAPSLRGSAHADPVRFGVEIARSLHASLGPRE